jgi:choline dehydrogenase-like flavoprotein
MTWIDGAALARPEHLACDVVVIGSGPAGSAAARVLTAAGARVIVVEAGPRVEPPGFARSALRAMGSLYRDLGATTALGTTATPLVQARMVGGSSPINGAICWRMPRDVWDGWAREDGAIADGLPWEALEAATDAVEARWNVRPTAPGVAGRKDALMAAGADAMGLEHRPLRRNVDGCEGLGRCMQGCPNGRKLSADRTFLADALAGGATLCSGVEVVQIQARGGRATGVLGRSAAGHAVMIWAREAVVLAASAVQSPGLLLDSGFSQGPVGQGFQGHPGVSIAGRFAEPVRMWEGATQGHEVIGLRGEGIKLETLGFDLTLLAARLDGQGRAFAARVAQLDRWVEWGAAIRSRARGRVRRVWGRTVVTWSPTAWDLGRYRRALAVMGEMMLRAGAEEVSLGVKGVGGSFRDIGALRRFEVEGPTRAAAYRAVITHMFGTCRAGSDPARSVVRPDLRHHAVDRLWVVDSSVFPTNLGVNPQVSIAAVATLGAGHLIRATR